MPKGEPIKKEHKLITQYPTHFSFHAKYPSRTPNIR